MNKNLKTVEGSLSGYHKLVPFCRVYEKIFIRSGFFFSCYTIICDDENFSKRMKCEPQNEPSFSEIIQKRLELVTSHL